MPNIEHWTSDHVPVEAYDRMRADRDHWREETAKCKAHHEKSINKCRERLEGAVSALRELLAVARGEVDDPTRAGTAMAEARRIINAAGGQ